MKKTYDELLETSDEELIELFENSYMEKNFKGVKGTRYVKKTTDFPLMSAVRHRISHIHLREKLNRKQGFILGSGICSCIYLTIIFIILKNL